jgi:hypothetical protein
VEIVIDFNDWGLAEAADKIQTSLSEPVINDCLVK